ncbi:MAG: hypothetical protein KatS3mg124_0163 [Porticoccaceae bacterium]|nr:MAG: hypothetical protein KatS3mg124_0163 [Porticoccaceae bacterium]
MRALLCKAHGPPESLEVAELPDPEPGPGQVAIQVAAAAVNFPDTLIIRDLYQFKPPLPFAPGGECAGTVCALGPGVSGLQVGDPVAAMPLYGAFAERVVCDAAGVVPLPAGLDLGLAAATLMAHGTALYALAERGTPRRRGKRCWCSAPPGG